MQKHVRTLGIVNYDQVLLVTYFDTRPRTLHLSRKFQIIPYNTIYSTYPGRRPIDGDKFKDSNCNGIYGINSTSGLSFEEELCAGSGARGIIYIGDSVGRKFSA